MHKPIDALLHKEMTRKEFLTTLGLGVASVMGFSTIVNLVTGKSFNQQVTAGYGSSAYGGSKEHA